MNWPRVYLYARNGARSVPLGSVPVVLGLLVGGCAHWQSHGIQEEAGASSVKLVESGAIPGNCRMLGPVTATRGALQDDRVVDVNLRNAAIEMRGNLVRITSRTTLTAKGDVHYCPAPAPEATPAPETTTPGSVPAPGIITVAHVSPAAASGGARVGSVQPAHGGIEENTLDARARELFVLGRDAYLQQQFEDALRYFNAAYQLSGRYELQYNIGQSADKLHRNQEALQAFERFLQSAPPSVVRTETEARVASLRSQ
jgi:hypothetical protein